MHSSILQKQMSSTTWQPNHSDEAYPLPVCSKAAELYDMESTWLTKAYTGEMSLADACSGLKEEADALLAK